MRQLSCQQFMAVSLTLHLVAATSEGNNILCTCGKQSVLCLLSHSFVQVYGRLQAPKQQLTASQRPLVVVVEEAEAVDTLTLQDLILVLSEVSTLCQHSAQSMTELYGVAATPSCLPGLTSSSQQHCSVCSTRQQQSSHAFAKQRSREDKAQNLSQSMHQTCTFVPTSCQGGQCLQHVHKHLSDHNHSTPCSSSVQVHTFQALLQASVLLSESGLLWD